MGCFGHGDASQQDFVLTGGLTWLECQQIASKLGTAQFALGSEINNTVNCHVGSGLATARQQSEHLCKRTGEHIYGGAHELAVYERATTSDTDTVTMVVDAQCKVRLI